MSSSLGGCKVFVGDLSKFCTEEDLARVFERCGDLVEVSIKRSAETGKSLAYGFVKFSDEDDALRAIETMDGTLLMGRHMRVRWAVATKALLNVNGQADRFQASAATVHVRFAKRDHTTYVTEQDLHRAFDVFENMNDIVVKHSEIDSSGLQHGYAFVEFTNNSAGMASALSALEVMNNASFEGISYTVQPSKSMARFLAGGGSHSNPWAEDRLDDFSSMTYREPEVHPLHKLQHQEKLPMTSSPVRMAPSRVTSVPPQHHQQGQEHLAQREYEPAAAHALRSHPYMSSPREYEAPGRRGPSSYSELPVRHSPNEWDVFDFAPRPVHPRSFAAGARFPPPSRVAVHMPVPVPIPIPVPPAHHYYSQQPPLLRQQQRMSYRQEYPSQGPSASPTRYSGHPYGRYADHHISTGYRARAMVEDGSEEEGMEHMASAFGGLWERERDAAANEEPARSLADYTAAPAARHLSSSSSSGRSSGSERVAVGGAVAAGTALSSPREPAFLETDDPPYMSATSRSKASKASSVPAAGGYFSTTRTDTSSTTRGTLSEELIDRHDAPIPLSEKRSFLGSSSFSSSSSFALSTYSQASSGSFHGASFPAPVNSVDPRRLPPYAHPHPHQLQAIYGVSGESDSEKSFPNGDVDRRERRGLKVKIEGK